jgi:negative regulator of sigma-B (phosphoserine phosphatase)
MAGEERSGDLAVLVALADGALVGLVDGLGHGDAAADAAAVAAEILEAHPTESPQALFDRCHTALRGTRGVVMTLVWFELGPTPRLRWVGVGNVEARLLRADAGRGGRHAGPLVLGGVVGHQLPRGLRASTLELAAGDTVALATDGIAADFSTGLDPRLQAQPQAELILREHAKGGDDALAVVARWLG